MHLSNFEGPVPLFLVCHSRSDIIPEVLGF
jgi:hypothetical protein